MACWQGIKRVGGNVDSFVKPFGSIGIPDVTYYTTSFYPILSYSSEQAYKSLKGYPLSLLHVTKR